MHKSFNRLSCGIFVATLATGAFAQSSETESKPESLLLVQHAESATFSDGTLTLEGTANHLIAFADRPERASGIIPLDQLAKVWSEGDDSFASDPPNAALMGTADGETVTLIVELTDPKLDGNTLSYGYSLLHGPDVSTIDQPYMVIDSVESVSNFLGGWGLAACVAGPNALCLANSGTATID